MTQIMRADDRKLRRLRLAGLLDLLLAPHHHGSPDGLDSRVEHPPNLPGRQVADAPRAEHQLRAVAALKSPREGVDTSTPTGRAVTSIMATIAELELELGKERRAASREARVARGLAATKPMKLDVAQQKRLLRLYQQGEPVSELTAMFGISRSTLFRTLKVLKQQPVSA